MDEPGRIECVYNALDTLHRPIAKLPRPILQRRHISIRAETANDCRRFVVEVAVVPPWLSRMHIAYMTFDEGYGYSEQCIADRYTRMRVSTRIKNDGINTLCPRLLYAVDDATFVVRLEGHDVHAELLSA